MNYTTLDYQLSDGILTITLNRPEHMNSFTVTMANELIEAINRASDDDDVRVIVFTGAGKAFCAGMDLTAEGNVFGLNEELEPSLEDVDNHYDDPEYISGVRDTGGRVTLALYDCSKPVIAAINGAAVGIGATMTLAMDIRLASSKAKIGFVFNKIGITPEACSTWFLPRVVGLSQALEWTYSAEILTAEKAKAGGLVKDIYEPEDLLEEAYKLARHIAENSSPVAIAMTRQMMYRNSAMPHPRDAHKVDSLAMFYASQKDGKEGVASFLEKRKPKFTQTVPSDLPEFYPWWE
ncbi:crotonase/enoyl-CoA hydratase family protein [Pseudomaricurvus sp.]|uniref:crotonase/enoyl-CoA hydratase family protein n=1 Tax=Pseudomaricurvus sp. TaxID=2004510 RepID=UPI003F6D43A9